MPICPDCGGRGLVHIFYRIDRVEQLAYCRCATGAIWKKFGAVVVRARLGLPAGYPVTELAWVVGDLIPLTEAPQRIQRALWLAGIQKPPAVRATDRRRGVTDRRKQG